MTDPFEPPPEANHAVVNDGEVFIWQPRPGIIVQKAAGILSLPLAQCFVRFYRPVLSAGTPVRVFDDFALLTHYTRDARELLTELTREYLFVIQAIHFLLSSKFMALGVSAFKHSVGDALVHAYTDRASFLLSFERAMAAPYVATPPS
jgi:hypothetical protein